MFRPEEERRFRASDFWIILDFNIDSRSMKRIVACGKAAEEEGTMGLMVSRILYDAALSFQDAAIGQGWV